MASLSAQYRHYIPSRALFQPFSCHQGGRPRRANSQVGAVIVPRASSKKTIPTTAQAEEETTPTTAQAEGLPESPLFNPQFAAVFQQTLQRQGKDALVRNAKAADERKQSSAEEMLGVALRSARRNVLILEGLKKQVAAAIEREEAQFERIHFSLRRATSDAAYIRTLKKLLDQEKEQSQQLRDKIDELEGDS